MAEVAQQRISADKFVTRIKSFSTLDPEFWSFKSSTKRVGRHALCSYPAMMVPEMQGLLIDEWCKLFGTSGLVRDPFVGAGTTLVECAQRGLPFHGVDINPLAILICKAKLVEKSASKLANAHHRISSRLAADSKNTIDVKFPGRDKWCSRSLCIALSRIRRSVQAESDSGIRTVCWTVVADVTRRFSNSRSETFKLHVRVAPREEPAYDIMTWFLYRLSQVFELLAIKREDCATQLLRSRIKLECGDARRSMSSKQPEASLIISSPPYGDNHTTVPYGQFSFLALNWICRKDLDAEPAAYANTRSIDSVSLGGRLRRQGKHQLLLDLSPSYRSTIRLLSARNEIEKIGKVSCFFGELYETLEDVHARLAAGGVSIWTTGDRTVGGINIPLASILKESCISIGARNVETISREIPSKRSPSKNPSGKTICKEEIVVCLF